ncbi:MAG: O-antigen polysaccharide polymerase Wzy, partial [Ignavibacteriae bacterium]|nr:O-antigen polysaccharide polymerase Wzy [Ignavibacteriota bacterium]
YFYSVQRETVWGNFYTNYRGVGVYIYDYYDIVLIYYGLALLFFIFGYNSIKSKSANNKVASMYKLYNPKMKIILVFFITFLIVLTDFLIAGVNPFAILLGTSEKSMFVNVATTNYMRNFADTIAATLIIAYYFKVEKKYFVVMVLASFILFALLGFRYRIIITILGIFFVYVYKNRIKLSTILKLGIGVIIFVLFMLFITVNRFVFVRGDYKNMVFNPTKFDYGILFEQTRGILADINVIKYMEVLEPSVSYDYGITFLYFIVRALPRSIVGNEFKDSLYPAPAPKLIMDAYMLPNEWTKTVGEAPLHYCYFYIAGGLLGLFGFSYFFGIFYKWWKNKFPINTDRNIILQVILCIITFQWISRGYFPQTLDHFSFLIIGCFTFFFLARHKFSLR